MNIHERLEAFWLGERPDQIPYTIYQWEWRHTSTDPAWQPMYDAGLGVTHHLGTWWNKTEGVETVNDTVTEGGVTYGRSTMKTPVGDVWTTSQEGWTQQHWLKTPQDYRVMTWIAQHTEVLPAYEGYIDKAAKLGPAGVPLIFGGRTPIQTILVDYAGLENFAMQLFDMAEEVATLYDALLTQFRRRMEIIAQGPGRFVSVLENFTAETLGPARFGELILPVYKECFPMVRSAGKVIGTHYDGKIASCVPHIAGAPVDLIESLTEPPEGDLTLDEARRLLPDKLFWSNINVSDYQLPPRQLRGRVHELIRRGAVGGKRLAFEVSEHIPVNWKESIPVVLEALREERS